MLKFRNQHASLIHLSIIEIQEQNSIYKNLEPKKILCLKKNVEVSDFYNENKKQRIYAYGLYEYFKEYAVFLVKNETNFI